MKVVVTTTQEVDSLHELMRAHVTCLLDVRAVGVEMGRGRWRSLPARMATPTYMQAWPRLSVELGRLLGLRVMQHNLVGGGPPGNQDIETFNQGLHSCVVITHVDCSEATYRTERSTSETMLGHEDIGVQDMMWGR
jgi:hypothetical protein